MSALSLNGVLIALAAAIVFGLYPATSKVVYADGANISFVVVLTTFFRALALVIFCLITKKSLCKISGKWKGILLGGAAQACSIFGIIASIAYIPGAITIILMFLHVQLILLYSIYKREIKSETTLWLITLGALFGVVMVVNPWGVSNLNLVGVLLALFAALATAVRVYLFGKQLQNEDPAVVGAQTFSVSAFLCIFLLIFSPAQAPHSIVGVQYLALSTASLVGGTFLMFYGIKSLGSFQWSLFSKVEPIFTALFAFLILNEVLYFSQYLGGLIVILSLVAYHIFSKRISKELAE